MKIGKMQELSKYKVGDRVLVTFGSEREGVVEVAVGGSAEKEHRNHISVKCAEGPQWFSRGDSLLLLEMPVPDRNSAPKVTAAFPGSERKPMPNPTEAMLDGGISEQGKLFEAVWGAIRTWDVNSPEHYAGYCGASGSHAAIICFAVEPLLNQQRRFAERYAALEVQNQKLELALAAKAK